MGARAHRARTSPRPGGSRRSIAVDPRPRRRRTAFRRRPRPPMPSSCERCSSSWGSSSRTAPGASRWRSRPGRVGRFRSCRSCWRSPRRSCSRWCGRSSAERPSPTTSAGDLRSEGPSAPRTRGRDGPDASAARDGGAEPAGRRPRGAPRPAARRAARTAYRTCGPRWRLAAGAPRPDPDRLAGSALARGLDGSGRPDIAGGRLGVRPGPSAAPGDPSARRRQPPSGRLEGARPARPDDVALAIEQTRRLLRARRGLLVLAGEPEHLDEVQEHRRL